MMNSVYIAKTIESGINFIKANKDWKQVTHVSFKNDKEHIVVISQFIRIRGRRFENIYLNPDYYENREWDLFSERIHHLGIEPNLITQRQE